MHSLKDILTMSHAPRPITEITHGSETIVFSDPQTSAEDVSFIQYMDHRIEGDEWRLLNREMNSQCEKKGYIVPVNPHGKALVYCNDVFDPKLADTFFPLRWLASLPRTLVDLMVSFLSDDKNFQREARLTVHHRRSDLCAPTVWKYVPFRANLGRRVNGCLVKVQCTKDFQLSVMSPACGDRAFIVSGHALSIFNQLCPNSSTKDGLLRWPIRAVVNDISLTTGLFRPVSMIESPHLIFSHSREEETPTFLPDLSFVDTYPVPVVSWFQKEFHREKLMHVFVGKNGDGQFTPSNVEATGQGWGGWVKDCVFVWSTQTPNAINVLFSQYPRAGLAPLLTRLTNNDEHEGLSLTMRESHDPRVRVDCYAATIFTVLDDPSNISRSVKHG